MRTIKYPIIIMLLGFLLACEEEQKVPITEGEKPGKITEYSIKNFSGGAEISYEVPDKHVAYVMAEYRTKTGGELYSTKSSKFKNSILVQGYPAAGEYDVKLYAVGRDEQRSGSISVTVNPETPPVINAFSTLKLKADFGGVNISGLNDSESNLVTEVITTNAQGEWEIADQYYSSSKAINFSVRGYNTDERQFGAYIRDRWLNYSDTIFANIKPYFEARIDMSDFEETHLPGDQWENHQVGSTRSISKLFDGRRGSQSHGYYSVLNTGMPQHFTIDLGDTYQLSRLKYWQHLSSVSFGSANPRKFKVWGSMDPNPNGEFDESWYLIGDFEDIKPSGLPVGDNSAEDMAQAEAGEEFSFTIDTPPVRYIRFQTLETWGKTQHVYITEMELWGSKVE